MTWTVTIMAHVKCYTINPPFQQDKKWSIQTLLPRAGIHPQANIYLDMVVDREDDLEERFLFVEHGRQREANDSWRHTVIKGKV
jgi:hypothetical protein